MKKTLSDLKKKYYDELKKPTKILCVFLAAFIPIVNVIAFLIYFKFYKKKK